jgi:hypothetical protein
LQFSKAKITYGQVILEGFMDKAFELRGKTKWEKLKCLLDRGNEMDR